MRSTPGPWLDEASAKALLAGAGIRVPPGRVARDEDDAAEIFARLAAPVALKLVAAGLRHKTEAGAVALGSTTSATCAGPTATSCVGTTAMPTPTRACLVEAMAPAGVELLVSAAATPWCPCSPSAWAASGPRRFGDVAVIPLPADAARVERALRSLRAAPLLAGTRDRRAGRRRGRRRARRPRGRAAARQGLELLELNPVLVNARGAVAVDALVRTAASRPQPEGRMAA